MSRHRISRGLAAAVACFTAVMSCSIVNSQVSSADDSAADPATDVKDPPREKFDPAKKAKSADLGGEDRFLTSITTDKPIYKAGEKVYVRGVLLNAANHRPLGSGQSANATIEIKGPKGDVVAGGQAYAQDSVWGFAWEVPAEQAGGEYKVHVTYPWDGHAPAERKFDIRMYRAPRLKSQITFMRDGYGPGQKVSATLDVKRAEGGVPEGAKVNVTAMVDGTEINGGTAKVDANGLCSVSFDLPKEIERGEGTLALVIEDGGVVETASKTIPILLQTVDVQLFPEGGELVGGYSNRVYVQAKQPNGKPADLVGKIMLKGSDRTVAEFRTEHEGRGRFEFKPSAGREYYLAISEPAGIKTTYPLPHVRKEGAIIHSDKEVFGKQQPITVQVGCTDEDFRVSLTKREVEIANLKIDRSNFKPGEMHPIAFKVPQNLDGVLTVTIWDKSGMPLAERLIFRQPASPLNISITPEKSTYVPGDNAKLKVKATDADGKPVSAVVGLAVTDDSVLEMVEKREQAPRLPVMVFLEPEVKDLADAHVYLDPKNPKASLATDLLLGTQGWRRFALMDLAKFIERDGDKARQVVALKIQSEVEVEKAAAMDGAMPMAMAAPGGAFNQARRGAIREERQNEGAIPLPVPKPAAVAAPPVVQLAANIAPASDKAVRQLAEPPAEMAVAGRARPLQDAMRAEKKRARGFLVAADEAGEFAGNMSSLVMVREFAHATRKDRKPTDRIDFTETLYWNTGVKTDATTGEATVSFGLNDSVSTFRVFADAFGSDGAIGAANVGVESVQPFYSEAKLPLEVTAGDKILLPINLINATNAQLENAGAQVDLKGDFKLAELLNATTPSIGAGQRVRWIQPITVGITSGSKDFVLSTKAGAYEDKVTRKLSIKPKGFPIETAFGGMIEPGKPIVHTITIPKGVVPGSLASNTGVYPTPLANLTEALQRMIQDPYGCFEQTSSTSYPLTMAQQYFVSHQGVDPKLVETSKQKLDAGYKRLVGYWCPDRGYEWFGENPGHEALTAFGLLHFTDMAKVREVDQKMIDTTRAWLLKQKDGEGGFSRKRRSLHTWIEDKDCSNAYICWALLEANEKPTELTKELNAIKAAAATNQNNYVAALAANALFLGGEKADAKKLMDRLASKQQADGSVDGIKASIVGSGGESLKVEGTALATLAWMRDPAYTGNVEKSIKYLADSCKDGRYGSTQATVLALRSIVTYDAQRARPKAPGKVHILVDGQPVGDWAAFNQSTQGAIKLPDVSELLTPGDHKVELVMEGGAPMPYSLAVKYNAITPASSKECKLDVAVKLASDKLTEGSATEANVTVTNKSKEVIPNPVAIVGLPAGLEPRHDQLKELVKKGTIAAYEVLGREVVLYWRTLPADSKTNVALSLIAAVPGTYTGPASRAYLYYTDEHKKWIDGVQVDIAAK